MVIASNPMNVGAKAECLMTREVVSIKLNLPFTEELCQWIGQQRV
jgi:hypothetical protein